jgi:threonine synthase
MQVYSTRNHQQIVSLKEAVVRGLAEDGGLYMPMRIPILSQDFIKNLSKLSQTELFYAIAQNLIGDTMPPQTLHDIIEEVFNFDLPVVHLHDAVYSLELFHGPTLAFKDVGARFMSRLLAYFYRNENQTLQVVVATSGDTGSAVAAGFYEVPGIQVFILYPKGKVSYLQEKQLTTWGKNITAIEVEGTFDDCQVLVKQLLSDTELNAKLKITSANSINIARLIPQSFYYFNSFAQLQSLGKPIVYAVPSGNFGNLTGGILAQKMGLPIRQFIAATNMNDVVPQYLKSGLYQPQSSKATISNAMDVGAPSNFERLQNFFPLFTDFHEAIQGFSYTDEQTGAIMKKVYETYGYQLDPHGAVAYMGLMEYLKTHPEYTGVFLETAHPAKFKDTVESILGVSLALPESLQVFANKEKKSICIDNHYQTVVDIIQSKN